MPRYIPLPFGPTIDLDAPFFAGGGIAIYANGTGTAAFDHLLGTQYPNPALSLGPVVPRLGSSNVAWNANQPAGTSVAVATSLDGGATWNATTSGSGIPGLTGQPLPTIDVFISNTGANYTTTNISGGSVSTVTYDTANSRITMVGGTGGLYLYSLLSLVDIDVLCDMDRSDAGGLVWCFVNASNYYELGAYDDTASGGFTNQLRLYKVASGVRSLLGSASVITWPRATAGTSPNKRIRVTMLSSVISVYFDGTLVQSYTDGSPLGAGLVGLRNDGGTSRYYQLRIQPQGAYVSGVPIGDSLTAGSVYTQVTLSTTDPAVTPQLLDLTTSARSPQIATGALITQLHDPKKPFAAFYNAEMAALTKASGDYYWQVDQTSALTFVERHATPAPFCLQSADLLNTPSVQPNNAADLYRNRQTITNCVGVTGTLTETKIADGSANSWSMAYPLYSAPVITVSGVSKTIGVQGVDTGKDFYWQANSPTIGQDSGAAKIPSGYVNSFTYIGQFPTQVTADNLPEQAARALIETGTTGIVEAVEDGLGMLASNALIYANGLLARFGNNNTVEIIATTLRSGLAQGQIIPVFIPEFGINNAQLLIVKVTTDGYLQSDGSVLYEYTIDATSGPNISNWGNALFV
jgi:hypothetical protein